MIRRLLLCSLAVLVAAFATAVPAMADTAVPGKSIEKFPQKYDQDENGIADEGVVVVGHYYSTYAEDATKAYWWDLGDGRIYNSPGIESIADLDQETLTVCEYVVNYKGTRENDPYQDTGNIDNHILCKGYDPNGDGEYDPHEKTGHFNYQIVHETDPRYRGIPENSIWDTWEYHVLTESRRGNLLRPYIQE